MKNNINNIIIDIITSMDGVAIGTRELDPEKPLIHYGIDSITFIQIVVKIEEKFKIEFDENDLDQINMSSIREITQYLEGKISLDNGRLHEIS